MEEDFESWRLRAFGEQNPKSVLLVHDFYTLLSCHLLKNQM